MQQVTLAITFLGVLSGLAAMVLAFLNIQPMRRLAKCGQDLNKHQLSQLSARLQIAMVCSVIAGASQVWQNHVGVALIWMAFFILQFRNWSLLYKHT